MAKNITVPESAPRYGGYTVVARVMSDVYSEWRPDGYRRQQVHMWWVRRERNGFPEKHQVSVNGKLRDLLDVREVIDWFEGYVPSRGGRGSVSEAPQTSTPETS